MRFMILVRASADTEAERFTEDTARMMAEMTAYHEELARAGVLLDAAGLKPTREGFRVVYDAGKVRVVDGPFTQSQELVAGYTLIQVRSREEALEWARRYPNPMGGSRPAEIEVRPLYEERDFEERGIPRGDRRETATS